MRRTLAPTSHPCPCGERATRPYRTATGAPCALCDRCAADPLDRGAVSPTAWETFAALSAAIDHARGWIADCWSSAEVDPLDLDPAEVVAGVHRHYVGGWRGFLADLGALDLAPVPAAPADQGRTVVVGSAAAPSTSTT